MMLEGKLDELAECVATMLGDCGHPDDVFPDVPDAVKFFSRDRHMLNQECALGEMGTASLAQAADLCMDDPEVRGTATRGEVEKVIEQVLIEGVGCDVSEHDLAGQVITNLTAGPREFSVILPVLNLRLNEGCLRIGKVTLLSREHSSVEQRYATLVDDDPTGEMWREFFDEEERLSVWAQAEVVAFPGSEFTIARAAAEEALNYLRCVCAAKKGLRAESFGVPATFGMGRTAEAGFREDSAIPSQSFAKYNTYGQQIDKDDVDYMHEFGAFDRINHLLSIPVWERHDPTEMKTRLSAAIHWVGRAAMQNAPAYQAADYSTAIDSLALSSKRGHGGKREFANRTCWLVETWCQSRGVDVSQVLTGPRIADSDELNRWSKKFYKNARCTVIHDGAIWLEQGLEQTLGLWPGIALMAICVVAENLDHWPTFEDFEEAYGDSTGWTAPKH